MVEKSPLMSSEELVEKYKSFIRYYRDENNEPIYQKALAQLIEEQKRSLSVNWYHLYNFNPDFREIAEDIVMNPSLHISAGSSAIKELVMELMPMTEEFRIYSEGDFHLRFYNVPTKASFRDLTKFSIGRLIEIEGIITRVSDIYDKLVRASFICTNCGRIEEIDIIGEKLRVLEKCPECGAPMKLDHEMSKFIRWRSVRIQERPEDLPPGMMPEHVDGILTDDIVDDVKPGDRVRVTGIIRIKPARRDEGREGLIYKRYLEIIHVEVPNRVYEKLEITPEDEEEILKLSEREDLEELIVKSIAPSVFGWADVKRAIAYALFGGSTKILADGSKVRGEINVLLVGDPGVAKSQLLKYTAQLAPRGLYTTGKGSTAAGLTAAVVRDSATGGWTLEAGALVLADMGVACIDEFDKMSEDDRRSIHEAMEQQTISIAKAGIVATLNARTTIIAAANPKKGKYDDYVTVAENINLPPTILSRFDLVFIMKDRPGVESDSMVAEHILITRMGRNPEAKPPIDPNLLKKYIAYAKQNIDPILTDEAAERIKNYYVDVRGRGIKESEEGIVQDLISITPRQLEALIRLSEARARMHLRREVTAEDAEMAINLMEITLKGAAYDIVSGHFDITGWMTGISFPEVKRREVVFQIIKQLAEGSEDGLVDRDVVVRMAAERLNLKGKEYVIEDILRKLNEDGLIIFPPGGKIRLI
ncbi:Minichromosome maintenance protein MCM [Candidatus Korarchaeum cryptofilum]|jgi:replicative DNA helicase Mcm|uniref:DNA helicase n=2 Tax=Candidatus Korarchaeum cryptofilum TaxID=498846 RepID=A0A429G3V1_9CREN|nr:Minichromosome maintenance protein MCM [Candidatus Korarchaeum cryptofilum]